MQIKFSLYIKFISLMFAVGSLFLVGCSSNSTISGKNVRSLYDLEKPNSISVEYRVLNVTENEVKVLWRLPIQDLVAELDQNGNEVRGISFRFKSYFNYSDPNPVDSGLVILNDLRSNGSKYFSDTLSISLPAKRKYVLDVVLKDLNSVKYNNQFLDIDLTSSFSQNNCLALDLDNKPIFKPYFDDVGDYGLIVYNAPDVLYVKHYQRDFPISSAPFAVVKPKPFDFKPDELFEIRKNHQGRFILPIRTSGLYQLVKDSSDYVGPTFSYFGKFYPQTSTLQELFLPLRYITTTEEYEKIRDGENLKKEVDSHWLSIAGSPVRAKELIKEYYSRVTIANDLFASYLEGWKSDRGMCYIVFGKPDAVYRKTASETWIYGEEGSYNSLSLTFTKVANPFSSRDYRLNRSASLKSAWYRAVEFWRQGRVISYK